jgi:predicted Fe-Mo cluster-binding NifX family protein
MKIAVTSQDFRTVTAHAGKTRRFLVYEIGRGEAPREIERIELPPELTIHEFGGGTSAHPLRGMKALITGGAGGGFVRRMESWGVQVAVTDQADPVAAVLAFSRGELAATPPGAGCGHHHHEGGGHEGHEHGGCGNC